MIKLDKKDFILEFDNNALNELKKYQQKNGELESGGILLGEIYLQSSKVIIKEIIVSKKAKRSFLGVNIDKKEMQIELEKKRIESDYTLYYIGDWHTHPEPFPTSSMIDRLSYNKIIKKAKILTNFIVFVIIGNHNDIRKSINIDVYFIS
jgi:integrative and conjugative element protein (TIGR02256 family)